VTELWRVIAGLSPGRRSADQITLFDSVGFAIEDFSALRYVHSQLAAGDFHEDLDLLADPDEPRDLLGMVHRAEPSAATAASPPSPGRRPN
jgi:ornithine cyclodeaminase